MPKVSIIVPVYNVEKYLCQCLESLVHQTLTDIEIICVDDGSTDNSLGILNKYAQLDSRIKVFSQKNQGVSSARNLGLEKVNGEYITFVDSDDWIELNACEILYNTAQERNTDILLCSYYNYDNKKNWQDIRLVNFCSFLKDSVTDFLNSYNQIFATPMGTLCKFYNAELLKNNNIKFPSNIKCGEDRVFYIFSCIKAKNISAINTPLYYYRHITNSLSTSSDFSISHTWEANQIIKNIIKEVFNSKEIYNNFLEISSVGILLYHWNAFHNHLSKKQNFKYLLKLKKEFNHYSKQQRKNSEAYRILSKEINDYKNLYWKKLLEPLIEIEFRRNRFVIYLFERQVLNFSTRDLKKIFYNLRYFKHLIKLTLIVKKRRIRVGFWVTETQKWSSLESTYRAFEKSKYFEPFVLLSYFKKERADISKFEFIKDSANFFKTNNIKFFQTYFPESNQYLSLKDFKPDIVFYQQPWSIHENQDLETTSKFALTAYVPYCYYSLNSYVNYLYGFHGILWKYFVETKKHKLEYEKKYNAKNCIAIGSPKLDCYKNLKPLNIWKTDKKRIIYAPHHSFNDNIHEVSTFKENGDFILKLAQSNPDTEWVFRPHPAFLNNIIENKIMAQTEIENYFKKWEDVGSIYTGNNYYELFNTSDCLITDCISFLTEYLPTKKPVIHLRKDFQYENFNELLTIIIDDYYKVFDNKTLEKIFKEVIIQGNDYLKEKRCNNIKHLMIDKNKTSGEKIVEHLEKIFKLRK